MAVEQFSVPDMTGAQGVQSIHAALAAVPGVARVQVRLSEKVVQVTHDGTVRISTLLAVLKQAGYEQVAVLA